MKLLTLIMFSMGLFSLTAYTVETVTTVCFFVTNLCHKDHAKELDKAINQRQGYLSHSTTSTKSGVHSIIVYK
jgi:hypothetical protein